jgi:rhodanese-related sulfurtransferase
MFKDIRANAFAEGLKNDPNAVLVDVRSPMEYHEEHIPDAQLINLMGPDFAQQVSELDPEKTYYVYCRSGNRSATACGYMAQKGFKDLYNLAGGLSAWSGEVVSSAN